MPKLSNNRRAANGKLRVKQWLNWHPGKMESLKEEFQVFAGHEGKWYRVNPETGGREYLPEDCTVRRVHDRLAMDISTSEGARAYYHFVTVYGYNKTRTSLSWEQAQKKIAELRTLCPDYDWQPLRSKPSHASLRKSPRKSPKMSPRM